MPRPSLRFSIDFSESSLSPVRNYGGAKRYVRRPKSLSRRRVIFPESITSIKDGTLIVGSLGHGNVLRIAPGKTEAVEWIKPGTGGLNSILGVLRG